MNIKSIVMFILSCYGLVVLLTSFIITSGIFYTSTKNYQINGEYNTLIYTNIIGEHWYEVILLLSAIPGVLILHYYVLIKIPNMLFSIRKKITEPYEEVG